MDRHGLWWVLLVTAIVYAPSLSGWYVYEDIRPDTFHVYQEPMPTAGMLLSPRSLTRMSHAFAVQVFGADPFYARAVNLAWHLLNGCLLWMLARRTVSAAASWCAAGLFLLLTIQSEAVAGIAYRSELIAATWLLIALWAVQRGWIVAAFLLACAAVTGKEIGIMALALVPLWAWWHRIHNWTPTAAVYWLAASFAPLLLLLDRSRLIPWLSPEAIAATAASALSLLALMVWPHGLTIDHDWASLTPLSIIAAVVLCAGALETAWRRSWPRWGFAVLFTLIALLPRFVWNLGEGLHERHLYTSVIAWSLTAGAALFPET